MHAKATVIFYGLSIFVLGTALFLMQPNRIPEVVALQDSMRSQISVSWQETWGDQPYLPELAEIYSGVTVFYAQASEATIALLDMPEADADLYYVFGTVYRDFAGVLGQDPPEVALEPNINPNTFMVQEPIYNIVPNNIVRTSTVSGASIQTESPLMPWVTAQDAMTGQEYCVSIFYGEVNKYLGECSNDYR